MSLPPFTIRTAGKPRTLYGLTNRDQHTVDRLNAITSFEAITEAYLDNLDALAIPGLGLHPSPYAPKKTKKQNYNWVGGLPFLEKEDDWPRTADGRPMLFVAALNLSLMHRAMPKLFPNSGWLNLFLDPSEHFEAPSCRVVHQPTLITSPVSQPPAGYDPGKFFQNYKLVNSEHVGGCSTDTRRVLTPRPFKAFANVSMPTEFSYDTHCPDPLPHEVWGELAMLVASDKGASEGNAAGNARDSVQAAASSGFWPALKRVVQPQPQASTQELTAMSREKLKQQFAHSLLPPRASKAQCQEAEALCSEIVFMVSLAFESACRPDHEQIVRFAQKWFGKPALKDVKIGTHYLQVLGNPGYDQRPVGNALNLFTIPVQSLTGNEHMDGQVHFLISPKDLNSQAFENTWVRYTGT